MRIGLTFDPDSQSSGSRTEQLLQDQACDVVSIGCAKSLVDKLAAGDRFDLIVDCCNCDSPNSNTVLALAALYEMPAAKGAQLVSAIEAGKCIDDVVCSDHKEARRPHMLQMATAKSHA